MCPENTIYLIFIINDFTSLTTGRALLVTCNVVVNLSIAYLIIYRPIITINNVCCEYDRPFKIASSSRNERTLIGVEPVRIVNSDDGDDNGLSDFRTVFWFARRLDRRRRNNNCHRHNNYNATRYTRR